MFLGNACGVTRGTTCEEELGQPAGAHHVATNCCKTDDTFEPGVVADSDEPKSLVPLLQKFHQC